MWINLGKSSGREKGFIFITDGLMMSPIAARSEFQPTHPSTPTSGQGNEDIAKSAIFLFSFMHRIGDTISSVRR